MVSASWKKVADDRSAAASGANDFRWNSNRDHFIQVITSLTNSSACFDTEAVRSSGQPYSILASPYILENNLRPCCKAERGSYLDWRVSCIAGF